MAGGTIYTTGTQGRDWTTPVPLNGANRALVEAAPDLLAALQAIVTSNVYGNPTQWNLCIDRGIAAIAKATGGAA
jgi:hypothetical protein